MKLNNRGNWTLIGLLAAVVIVVVLAGLYFGKGGGVTTVKPSSPLLDPASKKQTVVGKAMDTAKAADCQERLRQIRLGITNYKATSGTEANPKSFKDLQLGVSTDYFQCPVSGQAYVYDPVTGTVRCPTHTQY